MDLEQAAAENIVRWRRDPVAFVREQFKVEPDPWQQEVLMAFASNKPEDQRIAMQGHAGPGKSAAMAWCGWNFLACYGAPGQHPKGLAISCTRDNLRDNLWAEMAHWQERSQLLTEAFEWTAEKIFARAHPKDWFIAARSFSKTATAEVQGKSLSGHHAPFVLYLIDESGQIAPPVLKAAEQGLSTCVWGKIMQAGNPISHDSMLFEAAKRQAHLWHVVRLTGDPDDPMCVPRSDKEWAREQIKLHKRDSPWVITYILGDFPPQGLNSLLSPDQVDDAMERHLREDEYSFAQRRLGVDVAAKGLDSTVIFPRQGLAAFKPRILKGADPATVASAVVAAKVKFKSHMECVDATGGWGASTVSALQQLGYPPIEVQFAGTPDDSMFYNKRSEIWWRMAEWVKHGAALPFDRQLVRELTEPMYYHKNGKLILEDKDQIKKRLGYSPDMADALACTFALVDMPAQDGDLGPLGTAGQLLPANQDECEHDYHPFEKKR